MRTLFLLSMILFAGFTAYGSDSPETTPDSTGYKLDMIIIKVDSLLSIQQAKYQGKVVDSLQVRIRKDSLELARFREEMSRTTIVQDSLRKEIDRIRAEYMASQKKIIEQEIDAVLSQTKDMDIRLLESLLQRGRDYKAQNLDKITRFRDVYQEINAGYTLLRAAADNGIIKARIDRIREIDMSLFQGLQANKLDILGLLARYCEKYSNLLKWIDDAKKTADENKRKEILDGIEWEFRAYPFLMQELDKARNNRNYSMARSNCP